MENQQANPERRSFLKRSFAFALSFSILPSMARVSKFPPMKQTDATPPLAAELVQGFVGAAHGNLDKVKEMLEKEPMLVNACWDWGGGDFELAIGGAAHMGNRDIANYLLDNNARIDIFCAAMLGQKQVVQSLIKMRPGIANVPGPHKFPLLYHVAISGDVTMADMVKPHINAERIAANCNRSLQAAARGGNTEMIEWLFANGADDPNTKDVLGRTPLQMAEEKGHTETAVLLKEHGAIK
jgi:ankyrin repeat protein